MPEPARDLASYHRPETPHPAPRAAEEKSVVRDYAEALAIAIVLALVIRTFLFQAYKIPSGSMIPTLLIGDHILVNKAEYGIRMPDSLFGTHFIPLPYGHYVIRWGKMHRGDVVVFVFPDNRKLDYIKRIIAVGGDTIQVIDGHVWLNGKRIPDPHAHFEIPDNERSKSMVRDYYGPVTVPKGKLFMMGDNRDRSSDSRYWGFASVSDVEGKAIFIYFPWEEQNADRVPVWQQAVFWYKYVDWGRVGRLIH